MDQRSNKLLKLLEKDCTMSPSQLAAMCDTTEEDIMLRTQKLCEEGVILGYKALVNWEKTSVEAVEALVVGGKFVGDAPGCEDEEGAACAGVEASALGLPVGADRLFL